MDSLKNLTRISLLSYAENSALKGQGQLDLVEKFFQKSKTFKELTNIKPPIALFDNLKDIHFSSASKKDLFEKSLVQSQKLLDFFQSLDEVPNGMTSASQSKNAEIKKIHQEFLEIKENQKNHAFLLKDFFDQSFSDEPNFWEAVRLFFQGKERQRMNLSENFNFFDWLKAKITNTKQISRLYREALRYSREKKTERPRIDFFATKLERDYQSLVSLNKRIDSLSKRSKVCFANYVFFKKDEHIDQNKKRREDYVKNLVTRVIDYAESHNIPSEKISPWLEFLIFGRSDAWEHQSCLREHFNQFSDDKLFYFLSNPKDIFLDLTDFHCTCQQKIKE